MAGNSYFVVAALIVTLCSRELRAQAANSLQPEVRLDATVGGGDARALEAGFGVTAAVGTYVRAGVVVGVGTTKDDAGDRAASWRTDLVARFNLDPFRDRRWAPYAVGGVSARYGDASRTAMLLLAGVEGPLWGRMTPAVELGLAGGIRIAAIMRRGMVRRR